mgnify:CR=1 FL=1
MLDSFLSIFNSMKLETTKGLYYKEHPDDDLFFISYRDLYLEAVDFARYLKNTAFVLDCNTNKRQFVLLLSSNKIKYVISFWTCIFLGVIPLLIDFCNDTNRCLKIDLFKKQFKEKLLLIDDDLYNSWKEENRYSEDTASLSEVISFNVEESPEDILYVQYSSGTTAQPHGSCISEINAISNLNAINKSILASPDDRVVNWMPLTHCMGFSGLFLSASSKLTNQLLLDSNYPFRYPDSFMSDLSKFKTTITALPDFALEFMAQYDFKCSDIDLSDIRLILSGSDQLHKQTVELFYDKMSSFRLKRNTILPVYGLSEATCAVAFSPYNVKNGSTLKTIEYSSSDDNLYKAKLVSSGLSLDGEITIKNLENKDVDDGSLGEIYIQSSSISQYEIVEGILKRREFTLGNFNTHDVGFFDEGFLYILGRSNDTKMFGKFYSLAEREEVLKQLFLELKIFNKIYLGKGFTEDEHALCICVEGALDNKKIDSIKSNSKTICSILKTVRVNVYSLEHFPRTPTMKIKFDEMLEAMHKSSFIMTLSDNKSSNYQSNCTKTLLSELYKELFPEKLLNENDLQSSFEDSFDFIYFVNELNESFNCSLHISDCWKVKNIDQLVCLVRENQKSDIVNQKN